MEVTKHKKNNNNFKKQTSKFKKYKLISLWPVFQQILLHKKVCDENMCSQGVIKIYFKIKHLQMIKAILVTCNKK